MPVKIIAKNRTSTSLSPLDTDGTVTVGLRLSSTNNGDEYSKVDVFKESCESEFRLVYEYWKRNTFSLSVGNYDDVYFKKIVSGGDIYVPYIKEDLLKGCTFLIHALELIFPDRIPYNGYVSLKLARKLWLKIL